MDNLQPGFVRCCAEPKFVYSNTLTPRTCVYELVVVNHTTLYSLKPTEITTSRR